MAIRSFRPAPLLLSLFVGVAIAFLVHASGQTPPPPVPKGIHAIVVGPKANQLNYPKVQISKPDGEVAIWVAKMKTDRVRIEFVEEVFEGMMKQSNGRWVPAGCGTSRVCYSGNIKGTTMSGPNAPPYKYWQILIDQNGKEDPFDGVIIINP